MTGLCCVFRQYEEGDFVFIGWSVAIALVPIATAGAHNFSMDLLKEEKQIPRLNQKFFQSALQLVSRLYWWKEKSYQDNELACTFEEYYNDIMLWHWK